MDDLHTRENEKLKKLKQKLSRTKRKVFKHTKTVRVILIALALILLMLPLLLVKNYLVASGVWEYVHLTDDFVFAKQENVKSFNGRTNLLILGKGGAGHEAPELTDTIMLVSIGKEAGIDMISLPRDIWIEDLRAKLNSVYYWGNKKQTGGGLELAKASVEEIAGAPVHYAVVGDFSIYKNIIDAVGGIEVNVPESFRDERFPIAGLENELCDGDPEYLCRYETVSFEKGLTYMDGATALKFVRSRQAEGDEGTDFARARRQQAVLSALETKMTSREVVSSPKTISKILNIAKGGVETDLSDTEAAVLARFAAENRNNLESHVLGEEFLQNPPLLPAYDNLYVFIPKSEDWSEVNRWFNELLY